MRSTTHRELMSDLLPVKPEKADRWIQFRDVFEVDGRPIRDRSERLMKLFVEPSSSTAGQVEQIVTESARYNIGSVLRTINVPVFALLILDAKLQPRFKFARVGAGSPSIARDFTVPDGTWVIRYEETGHGTCDLQQARFAIRGASDRPATGRTLMSEPMPRTSRRGNGRRRHQSDVVATCSFPRCASGHVERRHNVRIDGAATYGKFGSFR
jgi:hypothetical protein